MLRLPSLARPPLGGSDLRQEREGLRTVRVATHILTPKASKAMSPAPWSKTRPAPLSKTAPDTSGDGRQSISNFDESRLA